MSLRWDEIDSRVKIRIPTKSVKKSEESPEKLIPSVNLVL